MPPQKPALNPAIILTIGILAVSTAAIFIRYAQAYAPSLVIAAWRLTLAALALAPLVWLRHRQELAQLRRGQWLLALCSGVFLALHFATWISSLEYTSVASSVVLVTTTPLWVALLAPFTLNERPGRLSILGMLIALGGGIVVGLSDSGGVQPAANPLLGDLLALTGAWMAAAYVTLGRRLRAGISLNSYIFVVYGVAAGVLLALMLAAGQKPWGYPAPAYGWFVLLALIPQLLGHSAFNWSLRYLSAAFVSTALLGEPIGSTILAYFLLQETPGAVKLIGAILILAGIALASRSPKA